jgi:hypothetical protein
MSDIFKQEQSCDNCGAYFNRQDLTLHRNHRYCPKCLQEIRAVWKRKERGGGEKEGNPRTGKGVNTEFQETKEQLAALEGKLAELEGALSSITAGTNSAAQEIAGTLKNIADQLKLVMENPPPGVQLTSKTPDQGTPTPVSPLSGAPLLPSPEFQEPSEADVRGLVHTPAVINWGAVIDLAIKCGWHRSYHTYLAFLRAIDRHYGDLLSEEYRGKPDPSESSSKGALKSPSLYSAWVSTVAAHVPLLQGRNLQWRDFVTPTGTGEARNTQARWQQAVLDYLIAHQNAPASSREIADALLPLLDSKSDEGVRRRMLQNVVATLTRRGILAMKTPPEYPKLFWIPDKR